MPTPHYLFVTGASGQLGRRVLAHLLDTHQVTPARIVAGTRHPERLAEEAERGVIVRRTDFDDEAGLAAAFAGAARVLIISTDKVEVPGARLRQHRAAVTAAGRAGVKHAVYTSMMRPEPGSPIPFAPDHYGTEQALASSPLTWTLLRNCWYTDFLLFSLPAAIASGQLHTASGDAGVAYVTREDCARACAAALASESTTNETLDITGPDAVSHAELARIVSELTRKTVTCVPVTVDQLRAGLSAAGLPPPLVELTVAIDINTRAGNVAKVSDTVRKLTGKPPQSVRDFLAAHAAALKG
jgi:NAD(P)H dehydrogenase (quinone)